MRYQCSSCGLEADPIVSGQGGRRNEFIPIGWSELTLKDSQEQREHHRVYCSACTSVARSLLLQRGALTGGFAHNG